MRIVVGRFGKVIQLPHEPPDAIERPRLVERRIGHDVMHDEPDMGAQLELQRCSRIVCGRSLSRVPESFGHGALAQSR
ncbi:hypothetical protein U1737_08985 [Sphingomonas sp. LB3N6]|uniref:hypothetical protein n=1 Tax=Sphingomonas fucosidasi TaxID=3096164 RepID=UPI002FCA10D0